MGLWCFNTTVNNISVISWREHKLHVDNDDVCFVQDQHAKLDLYNVSSHKQQSAGRYVDSDLRYIREYWKTVVDNRNALLVLFYVK